MSGQPIAFRCRGHHNLLGTHAKTLELTCDDHLTKDGDCIIGVSAEYALALVEHVLTWKRAKITVSCEGYSDSLEFDVNPHFCSEHEIVIRKSGFISDRTLGINATKASVDLCRDMIQRLKNPKSILKVTIEEVR